MSPSPDQLGVTIELDDRLYLTPCSSVPMVSYVLAVDSDARHCDDEFHASLKDMVGANYCGPVHNTLATSASPVVVDIASGSGQWVLEMGTEFPQVKFFGIDLWPSQRDNLPHNVTILTANFHDRWPFDDGSVDLIHMRQLQYATSSTGFVYLLKEAGRVLRSGGLLIAADTSRALVNNEDTTLDMSRLVPISEKYRARMFALMHDRGMTWCGGDISRMIHDTTSLGAPQSVVLALPIGRYKQPLTETRPLSDIALKMVNRMVDIWSSFRPLHKAKGGSDEEWDNAIIELEREVMTRPDITFPFNIVWANKL